MERLKGNGRNRGFTEVETKINKKNKGKKDVSAQREI